MVILIIEYFTQKVNEIAYYFQKSVYEKGGKALLYDNVKKLCDERHIPVIKLERELEFPRSSICKWNENEPGIRKVQKVAEYLGVPIEKLLEEKEEV